MYAGRSKRFGTHKPKPLALVEGLPNCVRTWNLVYEISQICSYLTVNKERRYYFDSLDYPIQPYLIEGGSMRETQRFSNVFPLTEETVFLYGDVIYSKEDLELILNSVNQTTWYGRMGKREVKSCDELMGVHVIDFQRFMDSVWEVDRQMKQKERKQGIGWDVYEVHEKVKVRGKNFIQLNSSEDFDTQEEYKLLINGRI